jgi:hypothetical protein
LLLAGRKDPSGLSGDVLVDGKRPPKNFKCMTDHVAQANTREPILHACVVYHESLLKVCEEFCAATDLQFNASKSVAMCFGTQTAKAHSLPQLDFCGGKISWGDDAKHLGCYLMYNLSEEREIEMKRNDLFGRVNFIIGRYGGLPMDVLIKIFNAQCCHFYGCQSWNLSHPKVSLFHTAFNRCVRRLLHLPNTTHTRYLPLLIGLPSSREQICSRFDKVIENVKSLNNTTVKFIITKALSDCNSVCYKNQNISKLLEKTVLTEDDLCIVEAIKELKNVVIFDCDESQEFINSLCSN